MAFVTDYERTSVDIANDVVTLPPLTTVSIALRSGGCFFIFSLAVVVLRGEVHVSYLCAQRAESHCVRASPTTFA
jgi:hypothetical protein